jgi:hypothetical protein
VSADGPGASLVEPEGPGGGPAPRCAGTCACRGSRGLGPAGASTAGVDLEAGDWLPCAAGPGVPLVAPEGPGDGPAPRCAGTRVCRRSRGLGPAGAPTVGADLEAGDWLHCAVGPGGGCAW